MNTLIATSDLAGYSKGGWNGSRQKSRTWKTELKEGEERHKTTITKLLTCFPF